MRHPPSRRTCRRWSRERAIPGVAFGGPEEKTVSQKSVHVVGTGTIGEPVIGLLMEFREQLGVGSVTFTKRSANLVDRPKVNALRKQGATFAPQPDSRDAWRQMGIESPLTAEEALDQADVVIDCTPSDVGL